MSGESVDTHHSRHFLLYKYLRNYAIDPTIYTHHLHKIRLIHPTDQLIGIRDNTKQLPHLGKVKSYTDILYAEDADKVKRDVVDRKKNI